MASMVNQGKVKKSSRWDLECNDIDLDKRDRDTKMLKACEVLVREAMEQLKRRTCWPTRPVRAVAALVVAD